MDVRGFRELARKHKIPFLGVGPRGLSWERWRAITDKVSGFDFSCNHDGQGVCAGVRAGEIPVGHMCCTDCVLRFGHFKRLPSRVLDLRKIASRFDLRTGFLGLYGCRLPHRYRSAICLGFICGAGKLSLSVEESARLEAIWEGRKPHVA